MKGSVTKYRVKGSSRPKWRFRLYSGRGTDGRKNYEGRGGFAKESEAFAEMQRRLTELRSASPAPTCEQPTFGDWLRHWLDRYAAERCQPKTLERYSQLARYVLQKSDDSPSDLSLTRLPDVRHQQIEAALFALLAAKSQRRKHISARTVRHVAGLINVALNKAFKLELISVNPMLRVELPSVEKRDARSLTPDEIRSLRDVCRGDWTFTLIEIALATGARRGELLALQWADVDWNSGGLTISKSLEQTASGLRIKLPKNGKKRRCQLPQSALAALRFVRDEQQAARRVFVGDYKTLDLVFCEADGSYRLPDLVSQVVIRRLRKAGIKDASIHTLRHTHASNLLSRGVPLPAVSARLGHADTNVTARVYSHALPADDQRAADVWDSVITGMAVQ